MSVWIKPRSFSGYQHIIGAPFQNGFYIGASGPSVVGTDPGYNLTFNLFNGTVWGIGAPSTAFDTWHHYVFIREGDTLKLYADNTYIGSTDITGESFTGDPVFSVGGGEYEEYYFNGDIDELGLWTRALTISEISKLYNEGNGLSYPFSNSTLIIKKSGTGELLYNPIAFWHLEESSGNRADATNNGYSLSEGDASVPNTIGKIGNAANFDGTISKFLTNPSISVGSTFSIACWVKLNSYNPNDDRAIWGLGAPSSATDPITLFVGNSNHFFGIYNEKTDPLYINTNITAILDTWYHIVSVFTGTDMKLYINGVLVGSETYVTPVDNSWTNFSLSNFYDGFPSPLFPIDAVIDEVGIWDIELSQEQVTNIYRNINTVFKIK